MSHDKRHRTATQEELRDQVEQAREDLGRTVEDLAAKADVKARAQDRAHAVKAQAGRKKAELRDRAGHGAQAARQHRAPLVVAGVGSGAMLLAMLLVRLRGHGHNHGRGHVHSHGHGHSRGRAHASACHGGRRRR